jgi:hypothetical protein
MEQSAAAVLSEIRFLADRISGLKASVDKVLDDHEKRIRILEFRLWFAMGGAALVGWLLNTFIRK